jgi:ABC-2 type transport system ATP-binding protein
MSTLTPVNDVHDAVAGGIVASRLSKSYGDVRAVDGLDLTIAPGETVALLGPNGAGKSTTLDMVLGLQRPDSGRVSLFGMAPAEAVAVGAVGGMLQVGSPVEHMRVGELVELLASYYPHSLAVAEVLEMTGLEELADRWASKLSAGQMQRVRFAGALVGDPDLIVLDEPTAGVDVKGRIEFWQSMRSVAIRGKTTIFATHYLEEADAYADRIVLMSRGRIVADGPATEIRARAGSRTIRATLPGVDIAELEALPGVIGAERHGDAVTLTCSDADTAAGALFAAFRGVRDIEIRAESLEQAFLDLTADPVGDHPNPREAR